jgi:hypothetical protein
MESLVVKVQVGESIHKIKLRELTANCLKSTLAARLQVQESQVSLFSQNKELITNDSDFKALVKAADEEGRCPKVFCSMSNNHDEFPQLLTLDTTQNVSEHFESISFSKIQNSLQDDVVSITPMSEQLDPKKTKKLKEDNLNKPSSQKKSTEANKAFQKVLKKLESTKPELKDSPELVASLIDSCRSKIVKLLLKTLEQQSPLSTDPLQSGSIKIEKTDAKDKKNDQHKKKCSRRKEPLSEKEKKKANPSDINDVLQKSKIQKPDNSFFKVELNRENNCDFNTMKTKSKTKKPTTSKKVQVKPAKIAENEPKLVIEEDIKKSSSESPLEDSFVCLLDDMSEANPEASEHLLSAAIEENPKQSAPTEPAELHKAPETEDSPPKALAYHQREQDPDLAGWTLL